MTLSELIHSFGDKSTDPLLSEPRQPPPFAPLGGTPPPPAEHETAEEPAPWDRTLKTLPLDSVFFDSGARPAAAAEPGPPPPFHAPPAPPSVPTEVPGQPEPGAQFTTMVGRETVAELNRMLGGGWRILHAVPLGSGEAMVCLEFGGAETGGSVPRGFASSPPQLHRQDHNPAPAGPEAGSTQDWVTMPAVDPFESLEGPQR